MDQIKLLLVDDQELIRESLAFVLNTDPELIVIDLADNGSSAIQCCETQLPDIVLMDIHMPLLNGIEATKLMKQRWPEVKVIMLTTFNEVNQVVEALSIGAEGYLLKAIHPNDLMAGIKLIHRGGTLLPQHLAQALVQELQTPVSSNPSSTIDFQLTDREQEVLTCIAIGLSNKQIAEKLFLSQGTVKNYISSIYSKLDVKDRVQAILKAQEEKLI
ncbi:response regulator [Exiguobacterium algae]|uniref:response regulator n=1 Tax=Exiguobacterium algae TaxID=2751250 RepID=UPI001BE78297|nr:response regulator transcription factor [Exiguobacterium algae]